MYRVIELQTNGLSTAMIDHGDFFTREQAESKRHNVAQYAAISNVEIHTVIVLNPEGEKIGNKDVYKHEAQTTSNKESGEE